MHLLEEDGVCLLLIDAFTQRLHISYMPGTGKVYFYALGKEPEGKK